MKNLWQGLETLTGAVAVPAVWRWHVDGDFERMRGALLMPTGSMATWYPSSSVCRCKMRVVHHAADRIVGVSECGDCDDVKLSVADVSLLALNWTKLGRALALAFGFQFREAAMPIDGVRQIGSFGGSGMPILLAVAQSQMEFTRMAQQLVGHFGKHFIVLTPTNLCVDGNAQTILRNAGAGLFALEAIVTVMPNGSLHAAKSAGELFSPFLAETTKPASDNEAQRLFALVKALELETKYRKAPVTRVFQLYCLEGQGRNEVAKSCACAPSLITLRLQALEKKLGRPPEQLRTMSAHFEKMADSLTDSRARVIYRREAINSGEEEE